MRYQALGRPRLVASTLMAALAAALLPAAGRAQAVLASPRADGLPAPVTASGGTLGSLPRISTNGRYVAFDSLAADLVASPPDANGGEDVYLHDLLSGTTTLVSVKTDGSAAGNQRSLVRGLSGDGRYVLFESEASDLVSGDNNLSTDVFVRDLQSGVTTLVSVAVGGASSGNNMSLAAAMSPDGRFVLFSSDATNLVPTDTNSGACSCRDVFVRDLQTATTALVSVSSSGTDSSNQGSGGVAVSDDGRYVTFSSLGTNLVAGVADGNGVPDVFRRDLQTGVTQLASADSSGTAAGNTASTPVAMTADGRYVLFHSTASNLTAASDTNSQLDVFVRDTQTQTTALASVNVAANATGAGQSTAVAISGDGRYVAFHSTANDLVAGDGGQTDGFVRDLQLGTTTLVSVDSGGNKGNATSLVRAMTPDARYVVLDSDASNLAAGDLNGRRDVFVRDRQLGTTTLASVAAAGGQSADGTSTAGTITPDGRYVTLGCFAEDVVAADFNGGPDVFVRDLQTASTIVVSARAALPVSATPSARSALSTFDNVSADGRFVAFASRAGDLVPVATRAAQQVYLRDLQRAVTSVVSLNAAGTMGGNGDSTPASTSADGRYVLFISAASDLVSEMVDSNGTSDAFVRDTQAGVSALVSVNTAGTGTGSSFSSPLLITPSGRHALFLSNAANLVANDGNGAFDAFVRDLQTATTTVVSLNASGTGTADRRSVPLDITPDGRFVLFDSWATNLVGVPVSGGPAVTDVYVRDLQTGTTELISINGAGNAGGNGSSNAAAISDDGRYVLFGSVASDLGPAVTPGRQNVYVRDRQTGTTVLVSRNAAGTGDGNEISQPGAISANGRYVAFTSRAGDLVAAGDANAEFDVFVRDLQTSVTELVSVAVGGTSTGNAFSSAPTMSADGRLVGFASRASDLVPGDTNGQDDAFVRDMMSGTTTLVSANGAGIVGNGLSVGAVVSAAGTRAVFHSAASNLTANDLNFALDVFAAPFPAPALPFGDGFESGTLIRWSGFRP
jgi:hypothetical protein